MKRIISCILISFICLSFLASCGKNEEKKPNEKENQPKEKEEYGYFFPENIVYEDYDGYEFRILEWGNTGGEHWSAYEFYYDENLEGDVVNEAIKDRDEKIEDKFNISISYNVQDKSEIANYCSTSISAGGDDFDLVSLSLTDSAVLAKGGNFLDLNDYDDYLNLDEDWWDQTANREISIKGHLFFTVSDLTLCDKNATWVVFFTKGLVEKYPNFTEGYEKGLYSMVDEGEWTIDKMYEMVKTVSFDVNGDGQMTDADSYGLTGGSLNLAALMNGCGSRVTKKDENDFPQYVMMENVDNLVESYNYVYEIVTNNNYNITSSQLATYGYADTYKDGVGGLISDNRVLFNVTGMNRCRLFRDLECDFGIIPVPKANKDQENYYSTMSMGNANCIAVPNTIKDEKRTFSILEALTCVASQTTYKAYIEKALTYKYLRDDDSAQMLDIIFDGRTYDSIDVYSLGAGNQTIYAESVSPGALASTIKKLEKVTNNQMGKGLEKIDKAYETVKRN